MTNPNTSKKKTTKHYRIIVSSPYYKFVNFIIGFRLCSEIFIHNWYIHKVFVFVSVFLVLVLVNFYFYVILSGFNQKLIYLSI